MDSYRNSAITMKKKEARIIPEETNQRFFAQQLKAYEFLRENAYGKIILDLGCGDGYGAAYLAKVAKKVTAIDYEEEIIVKAQTKYAAPNLKFISMDATNLEFADNSFDIVCSFQVIEHIPEERMSNYLSGVKRVLKNDGEFYVSTLNLEHNIKSPLTYEKNPAHTKEFTYEELKALLGSIFSSVKIYEMHLTSRHHFYLWLKRIGILNFLPDRINPVKRFYSTVTTDDFVATLLRSHNRKKAVDFYAICKKE